MGNRNGAYPLTKWREECGSGIREYFTVARYIESHKQTAQAIRKLPLLPTYMRPGKGNQCEIYVDWLLASLCALFMRHLWKARLRVGPRKSVGAGILV